MKKNLWLLLDNRQGSVNQARGIAHAIGDKMDMIWGDLDKLLSKWI